MVCEFGFSEINLRRIVRKSGQIEMINPKAKPSEQSFQVTSIICCMCGNYNNQLARQCSAHFHGVHPSFAFLALINLTQAFSFEHNIFCAQYICVVLFQEHSRIFTTSETGQ